MLGLHLHTLHTAPMPCDSTPGIYYRGADFAAGVYRNSNCRVSAWVGWNAETNTITLGPVAAKAGIIVGGVTGYAAASVLPLTLPSVAVQITGSPWLRATWIPTIPGKVTGGGHFSIEFKH